MIENTAHPHPYPEAVPHPSTLNDLRVHNTFDDEPAPTSTVALSGMVLVVILAIAAFVWLDPLHLLTRTEVSPPAPVSASTSISSAEPARPTERQETIAQLAPVPATKSIEVPSAPAPAIRAPQVPAQVVRPRGAGIKSESGPKPIDKPSTTAPQATPEEKPAQPVQLNKPEEKSEAPIVPKVGDDSSNSPKPASTNNQPPATE